MKEGSKRKIGFFGGTFDPPHFGHINLCVSLIEAKALDEVLVCPCGIPAVKFPEDLCASAHHRLEMVELAFDKVPNVSIFDYEVRKNSPSYTVETLKLLKKNLEDDEELYFLLGSDAAKHFPTWKEAEMIMQLAKPLVAVRQGETAFNFPDPFQEYFKEALILINQFDISSTELRNRLLNKKYCGHLIPAKVLDYIYSHQLYFS